MAFVEGRVSCRKGGRAQLEFFSDAERYGAVRFLFLTHAEGMAIAGRACNMPWRDGPKRQICANSEYCIIQTVHFEATSCSPEDGGAQVGGRTDNIPARISVIGEPLAMRGALFPRLCGRWCRIHFRLHRVRGVVYAHSSLSRLWGARGDLATASLMIKRDVMGVRLEFTRFAWRGVFGTGSKMVTSLKGFRRRAHFGALPFVNSGELINWCSWKERQELQ